MRGEEVPRIELTLHFPAPFNVLGYSIAGDMTDAETRESTLGLLTMFAGVAMLMGNSGAGTVYMLSDY